MDKKEWRRIEGRLLHSQEQKLGDFRRYYEQQDPKAKKALVAWLEGVVAAVEKPPVYLSVKLGFGDQLHDEEGNIVDEYGSELTPSLMLKVIKTWEAGECFTSKKVGDLF